MKIQGVVQETNWKCQTESDLNLRPDNIALDSLVLHVNVTPRNDKQVTAEDSIPNQKFKIVSFTSEGSRSKKSNANSGRSVNQIPH